MDNIQKKTDKIVSNLSSKPTINYNNILLSLYAKGVNQNVNLNLILAVSLIIILIVICTIAVIYNAFNISVLERISQFGILRCVGTTPAQIKKIVLKEAYVLSTIGIPIGLLSGILSMKLILYIIELLKSGELTNIKTVISPAVLIFSSIIAIITVFLSAKGPARRASKVSPLEAVRNSNNIKVKKIRKAKLTKLIFGTTGQFASRNLRRNKKRFRITIFSMLISIILFIVFGSLMDYLFKAGLADIGNPVSYRVMPADDSADENNTPSNIYKKLTNFPSVEKVYIYHEVDLSIPVSEDKINPKYKKLGGKAIVKKQGNSQELKDSLFISYDDNALNELKKNLKSGNINKNALNKENGVILMQTAKITHSDSTQTIVDVTKYKVGDEIKIQNFKSKNSTSSLKVMAIIDKGILNDQYNKNQGIILLSTEKVFEKATGLKYCGDFLVTTKPNVSHTEISNYLSKLKDTTPDIYYEDYDAQANKTRSNNITLSILLYGFIGVIILIGCLNIGNTISTSLLLRTREFAVLKAVGMTQGAIKKMILLEGVFYGLIAAFYGSIIGTLIYYKLFKILTGIQEIEWTIPWKNILISTIGAVAFALISSLIPMKKLNSGIIADNLKIDN